MKLLRHFSLALLALVPSAAFAQYVCPPCQPGVRCVCVATGIRMSFVTALQKILTFTVVSIISLATVLFLVGAAYMVTAGGNEGRMGTAKKLMAGSLIGMGIVLGSYTILRTVVYFIYVSGGS